MLMSVRSVQVEVRLRDSEDVLPLPERISLGEERTDPTSFRVAFMCAVLC